LAEPFLGELRVMSFNFPPKGWAHCNGQLLPINQNQALFSLLGTGFGGNGQTTFALPNLQDRVPIHGGAGHSLYEAGGEQAHTLTLQELPQHFHFAQASSSNADSAVPGGNVLASSSNRYAPATGLTSLHPTTVTNVGGSQAHENRQPYLKLNFCIALIGIFPSPN
jgi:microcystin-dependent protein